MPEATAEWMRHRVKGLTEDAELLYNASPGVANNFNTWSALKLIFLSSAVNMFTKVAGNSFDNIYYIDALAGSGITEHREGEYFIGSPILAMRASYNPFKKMYFIEQNSEYTDSLRDRLTFVEEERDKLENPPENPPDDWKIIPGNANDKLPGLETKIWNEQDDDETCLYLAFIDNEGLDVLWDSIESIQETWGDFLINFPTGSAVGRNVGQAAEGHRINEFMGLDLTQYDLEGHNIRERMLELYREEKLGGLSPPRSQQVVANISSGIASYEYDLIYATREDTGGEFLRHLRYTKKFIENFDGTDIGQILNIVRGNQNVLDQYLPDEDNGQRGLYDF